MKNNMFLSIKPTVFTYVCIYIYIYVYTHTHPHTHTQHTHHTLNEVPFQHVAALDRLTQGAISVFKTS